LAVINQIYGNVTALTVTGIGTLANGSSAISATVDNTTTLFLDVQVEVVFATASGATATGTLEVWAKESIDNTDFDDDSNDTLIAVAVLAAAGVQTRKRIVHLAPVFGGSVPPYWQLRIRNATGAALTSASVAYRGVYLQSV
jgi:hypothetical protein